MSELSKRLREHVTARATGMTRETLLSNGAWTMMLDAALSIEALEATNSKIGNDLVQVHGELKSCKFLLRQADSS